VVPSHPIFHEPLKVDLKLEDRPTPDNYFQLAGDKKLDKTIKVWRVQTRKFPEIDPGLVSNPMGFYDSPDAEIISSGLNSKGPDSVALARHANFFLWGFSASPPDMTPEARKCFVNAVCYIKRFDGQKPIVHKVGAGYTREGALWGAYHLRHVLDERTFWRELPPLVRYNPVQYASYRKSYMENFERSYPEDMRRRFGNDPEKYIAWFKENLEYLRFNGDGYDGKAVVDEDVKGLGVSNRKVELLDTCIAMLERGDRPELARRILERYTNERFADAARWRKWLEANRRLLFFTDVGGFKFLVAPESLIGPAGRGSSARPADRSVPRPDGRHPVVARTELSPSTIRRGDQAILTVRVETAPSWHIYAVEGSNGPGIATTLRLRLPRGVEAEGDWSCPKAGRTADGQMAYEGTLEFRRKLRIGAAAAPGPIEVVCELGYQACDPVSCRPPARAELTAKAEVVEAGAGR
jgi:hypothetical protein